MAITEQHQEFLEKLKSNHQVPKGLKPKVTTTELPHTLFVKWEAAHIDLASTLRDILSEFGAIQITELTVETKKTQRILQSLSTEEEREIINTLIVKATSKKREELTAKGINKARRRRGTAGSEGGNQ